MSKYDTPILDLLSEVETALSSHAVAAPTSRVVLPPGSGPVTIDCPDMLFFRIESISPMQKWGTPTMVSGPCPVSMMGVKGHLGITRCISTVNDNGAPSAAQITSDGTQSLVDADALFDILQAIEDPLDLSIAKLGIGPWRPLPAKGGMSGGEWELTLAF